MSLPVSLGSVLLLIITILLAWQLVVNITRQDSGNAAIYSSAVERGIEQLHNIQR